MSAGKTFLSRGKESNWLLGGVTFKNHNKHLFQSNYDPKWHSWCYLVLRDR